MLDRPTAPALDERSPAEHKFFFACLNVARENWPEGHEAPVTNEHHFRAWLACHDDVMHCEDVTALPDVGLTGEEVEAFFVLRIQRQRDAGGYAFLRRRADGALSLRIPRTMRYLKNGGMSRAAWSAMAEKVFAVIYREAGLEVETLKREARREHFAPNGFNRK
jgi:hypothetical protein